MFNWSNSDILRLLQRESGRLRQFLVEVPLNDLQAAVEQKQLNADLRFKDSRQQFSYKKNVLDMNLDEVIRLCYQQNIINFFERKLANDQTRIPNHPIYGLKLIDRCPEKYYLGTRSARYNRARQIEQAYGIFRDRGNEGSNSNDEANAPQQGEDNSQNNQYEYEDYEQDEGNDQDQEIPNNQEGNDQLSESQYNEDDFIVDDEEIDSDELIEDSVEELIRNRKKANPNKRSSQSEEKVQIAQEKVERTQEKVQRTQEKAQRTQEKAQISEQTTQRKLKKPLASTNQEIQLDGYLIEPQQLNLASQIQNQRSKRNQKKLKQQLKKLQSSFSTNPPNLSLQILTEKEPQPFVAARKNKKMQLQLD